MGGILFTGRARKALVAVLLLFPLASAAIASQGELVRASVSSAGAQGNGSSDTAVISGNGQFVLFSSKATNLTPGDTNNRPDLFRYNRLTGVVVPVSVTQSGSFLEASIGPAAISDDGRFVAFWSDGSYHSSDPLRTADVMFKDLATGVVERISVAADGSNKNGEDRISLRASIAMSGDGRFVAFGSLATNLIAGDTVDEGTDLFLRDRTTATTTLLSTEPGGGPGSSVGLEVTISGEGAEAVAAYRVQSADRSTTNLVVRDLVGGVETLVDSVETQKARLIAVAAGGGAVVVAGGQGGGATEYDLQSKVSIELPADVDWTDVGAQAFSPDLRFVAAPSLTSTIVVFDRDTDVRTELPHSSTGEFPNQEVLSPSISDDGVMVAFTSAASNLTSADTNAVSDAFLVRVGIGTFADDDGNPFEADIEWLFAEGITKGCGIDQFCPKAPVTREQMATFLVRALELPAATSDAFIDDSSSPHQADINALAQSGVTAGCGDQKFCPAQSVTREQMATFLVRALDLPLATIDYFTDDTGSIHEANINALAASQITSGCGLGAFCPEGQVLREQMAAFLHRALD